MKRKVSGFLVGVLAACAFFSGCAAEKATPPDYSGTTDQFNIFTYHAICDDWYAVDGKRTYLGESLITQKEAQKHADAGFNTYFINYIAGFNGAEGKFLGSKAELAMDYAHESGMTCIVTENNIFNLSASTSSLIVEDPAEANGETKFASEEELTEFVRKCLSDVIKHPAFGGVTLKDEPSYQMFTAMGQVYRAVKQVCPNAFVNMNLFPMIDSASVKQHYCEGGAKMGMKTAYRKYLELFYELVQPERIQYDDYPLKGNNQDEANVSASHLINLQVAAEYCRDKGLELYKVFQTCSYKHIIDGKDSWQNRSVNETDMYWQMNLGMAFGIKGYSYWSYYPVVNSAGEYYVEQTSFVDRMGNPNPTYAIMRKIHAEMRGMEKALMNFTYQGVRTFVNTPIPGDYAYLSGLEKDNFTYVETVEREGEGIILVTELYDEARDQFGYYVVNATAPTAQAEIVATVDFAQVKNVQVYENGEVYNQKLKDGKFSVLLSEGQGLFLLPY